MNKITFDRFRLAIPNDYVKIIDHSSFTTTISGEGTPLRSKYEQATPFFYQIITEYGKNSTIVEFNGKSLMDDYPSLINHTTISKCLENINNQGVCVIVTEQAIQTAYVLQCDVTSDIPCNHTIQELYVKINLSSSKKWCIRDVTSNRFTIESTNTTKRLKSRMVMYDKEEEMNRKTNQEFLHSVSNPELQLNYFKGKLRFELNLNSIDRIRQFFNLQETKLTNLLYSTADPIAQFLKKAISDNTPVDKAVERTGNLRELEHLLFLAVCGFDLNKVELVIRDIYGSSRSIKRVKEPYVNLMNKLKENITNPQSDSEFSEIRARLQYMLTMAFNYTDSSTANLTNIYYSRYTNQNDENDAPYIQSPEQVVNHIDLFNIPYITVPCLPE